MAWHPLEPFVRKLERQSELAERDRKAILALPYTPLTLKAHEYLIREGDPPHACAVLLRGFAFRQKLTGKNSRQILAVHLAGDALDFQNLFLDIADHSIQALTVVELAIFPRSDLQRLVQSNSAIGHALLVFMLIEASIFREWLLNIGRRDARTRIAHLLCELAVRTGDAEPTGRYSYELPLSAEQLADATGLSPAHVIRTLKALEADGLIVRSQSKITLPSWKRMGAAGEFNARYLHFDAPVASSKR